MRKPGTGRGWGKATSRAIRKAATNPSSFARLPAGRVRYFAVATTPYYWGRLTNSSKSWGPTGESGTAAVTANPFHLNQGRSRHARELSGIGVVAMRQMRKTLVKFIEYLTSAASRGRSILADTNNEYPVVADTVISGPIRKTNVIWGDFKRKSVGSWSTPYIARLRHNQGLRDCCTWEPRAFH